MDEVMEQEEEFTLHPVPVEIHGALSTAPRAADYGAYDTIVFTGTEAPRQLLRFDPKRSRAQVTCTGTGPVYIGSEGQAKASPPLGFTLATGNTLYIQHQQTVWIVPDGTHSATVSVAVERWGD